MTDKYTYSLQQIVRRNKGLEIRQNESIKKWKQSRHRKYRENERITILYDHIGSVSLSSTSTSITSFPPAINASSTTLMTKAMYISVLSWTWLQGNRLVRLYGRAIEIIGWACIISISKYVLSCVVIVIDKCIKNDSRGRGSWGTTRSPMGTRFRLLLLHPLYAG